MENTPACSFFWKHLCVRQDAIVQPCCRFQDSDSDRKLNSNIENLDGLLNDSYTQELRRKSLAGENIAGCRKCGRREAMGELSLRDSANQAFPLKGNESVLVSQNDIEYLEIFVGDTCNLKCMTCGPSLSTAWQADYLKLGWSFTRTSNVDLNYQKLIQNLPSLREVKFVGGEPLLAKAHLRILNSISDEVARGMTLKYYTNATIWPGPQVLEQWQRFKKIDLWLSIDGVGAVNEYLRYPSKWTDVSLVTRRFLEYSQMQTNLKVGMHATICAYNVFSIRELVDWYRAECASLQMTADFVLVPIVAPEYLAVANLPEALKEIAVSRADLNCENQKYVVDILFRAGDSAQIPKFVDYTRKLDLLRGVNVANVVPELNSYFLPEKSQLDASHSCAFD